MCLFTNEIKPRICEGAPIPCWKVVKKIGAFDDCWVSYYNNYIYGIGLHEGGLVIDCSLSGNNVNVGFHSYKSLDSAILFDLFCKKRGVKTCVLKCEIPIGAEYVLGFDIDSTLNYASSCIRVIGEEKL